MSQTPLIPGSSLHPTTDPSDDVEQAQQRWADAEWRQYELWEKIEVRFRRRRRLWILGATLAFLLLSAIPIMRRSQPRWAALRAARLLGQEINRLKLDAAILGHGYRIRFRGGGSPGYDIEQVGRCASISGPPLSPRSSQVPSSPSEPVPPNGFSQGVLVRSGALAGAESLAVLGPDEARRLGLPPLSETLCFDALSGLQPLPWQPSEAPLVGLGILPKEDLADGSDERLATLAVSGSSAQVSFE
jgi:hypothetical protein